jgi:2'-5' RNA ligase
MNRYFIAAIPPTYLANYITEVKQSVAEKYGSKAALNQPPHITLVPPFEIEKSKEQKLTNILENYTSQLSNFLITLKDYGSFPPKVIFINVEPNKKLNDLADNLSKVLQEIGFTKPSEYNYHPHVTVAFKDLTEKNYELAWEEYKDKKVYFSWDLSQISLLKYVDKQWVVVKDVYFKK